MSGNAPVPPPPPHSEPAQQPPAFQPRSQAPVPPVPGPDQQATAYQPVQPGHSQDATAVHHQPAYQQPPAPAAYQAPVHQAPPPAFAPGSGQQAAYQAQQPAPQPAYQPAPQPGHQPAYQPAPQPAYQPAYAEQPPASSGSGGAGGQRRGGKRLSAGWIAFIAIDVILVGIVIAFAISLAGGDTAPEASAGPDTTVEAPAQDPAAPPADQPGPVEIEGESVTSPSRNITCVIGEDGVRCGIAELATQPAPVDGCAGATGYVVTLTEDGVQIPCVPSAELPRKAGDDVPVLEYEQTKTVDSFSCTSSTSGMRCTDSETGKGFNVAKAGLSSF
jgi:hypothetical protein